MTFSHSLKIVILSTKFKYNKKIIILMFHADFCIKLFFIHSSMHFEHVSTVQVNMIIG